MGFLFGMSGEQVLAYRLLNESSGGVNILRFGAGPNGPLRTLGQYMLGSGATFGYNCSSIMDFLELLAK